MNRAGCEPVIWYGLSQLSKMGLIVKKPGILSTVQDLGRYGYRRFGINPTGVMDQAATRLLNILVGNADNDPVLEMHFPAPEIVFDSDCVLALGGADFSASIDGIPVENWRSYFAHAGSTLRFDKKMLGNRCYLAVNGGLKVDEWLGSASTNLTAARGGIEGRRLEQGDVIGTAPLPSSNIFAGRRVSHSLIPLYRPFPTVRIVPGAEFDMLDSPDLDLLENQDFLVSNNSNRMGFRLAGPAITPIRRQEMISSAVNFGTIQLLPDGQLIVLMAGHQTTGGYPRIAHVISRDLPLIAQLGAGDKVAFFLVDRSHAEKLLLEFEHELNLLRISAGYRTRPAR